MQAGRLNHKITIQQSTPSRDAAGLEVESWSTLATVWAEVTMTAYSGAERVEQAADQPIARNRYTVRMYYRSDVSPLNRIVHGTRVLDIESAVDPDGRRVMLLCRCIERVGETA